jgi:hypothetical protein
MEEGPSAKAHVPDKPRTRRIFVIHPHTELRFINEQIGYGVFATRFIPRGTIIWARDDLDQTFTAAQVKNMPPVCHDMVMKYGFVDRDGNFVLCWDLARYLNHSCDPSCRGGGYNFEIAVRDLSPGDEVTDDYAYLNLEYEFSCLCDSALCRKNIRPGDLLRYGDSWDRIVADNFWLIQTVAQPLWSLVKEPEKEAIKATLIGKTAIASCKENYYAFPALEGLFSAYSTGPYSTLTGNTRANHSPSF